MATKKSGGKGGSKTKSAKGAKKGTKKRLSVKKQPVEGSKGIRKSATVNPRGRVRIRKAE
jgi:hypothetical protein